MRENGKWKTGIYMAAVLLALGGGAAGGEVLTFDQPETAGISGFRAFWDLPVVLAGDGVVGTKGHHVGSETGPYTGRQAVWSPDGREGGALSGGLVFDAVHRSLLVRFPGAAEAIAARVNQGHRIERAELVLPFRATEMFPEHYSGPVGGSFLRAEWLNAPPNWHAVAWALRKPWQADAERGPTFNAYINGAGYWRRFGADDTGADRHPRRFGPTEVSYRQATDYVGDEPPAPVRMTEDMREPRERGYLCTPDTEGGTPAAMDITAVLTDAAFGPTLAARLRQFEDCGLLVRKEEVYDQRYHTGSAYEWPVATGRRGILIRTPSLRVTFAADPNAEKAGVLPPAADIAKLAATLGNSGRGGRPTATMPDAGQIAAWAERFGFRRPDGMPDWQWRRVSELKARGGGWDFPATEEAYAQWIDGILAIPPRQFLGHHTPAKAITALRYADALPEVVREHERRYFEAWLMPWLRTEETDHPQAIMLWCGGVNRHWEATRDWRGNSSFYRGGYNRRISTQNFNHLAAMGALFGGSLIGSEHALADGRYGLEHFLLRLWAWSDGTTQESIDHYYLGLTAWTQKQFADFGPTPFDRLLGQSMLAKTMDELIAAYHPGLRRFVAPSGRTDNGAVFVTQTGLQHLMHTLSPEGALRDLGSAKVAGFNAFGDGELPAGYVADEMLRGPWAPLWAANLVDGKPLPYRLTAVQNPYPHSHQPEYRVVKRSYLGRHYGLTSRDVDKPNTYHYVHAMAQWRRADRPVANLDEVVVMLVRPVADDRPLDWYGTMQWSETPPMGGLNHNVQHDNVLIALHSPLDMREMVAPAILQTSLGFFNFQEAPTWEIHVDGRPADGLPLKLSSGQRITIRDGVTFVGVLPIPATDLGRDAEVVIEEGVRADHAGGRMTGLQIANYMLKRDEPLDQAATDWAAVARAYGGFVVELGDATEYPDFAAFQRHIAAARLETRWDAAEGVAHLVYDNGVSRLETGFVPAWQEGPTTALFPYRRVNGVSPYPPEGIHRDSTCSQQGAGGWLEKGGAVLRTEPGRMAFLQTEPVTGTVCGWNPLPDLAYWMLTAPGADGADVRVEPDGRVSVLRVELQPRENRLRVECGFKDEQASDATRARAILAFGLGARPVVTVNGETVPPRRLRTARLGTETALIVPLDDDTPSPREIVRRYAAMIAARDAAFARTEPAVGTLRAESDSYLFSVPRAGVSRFQRLWPTASVVDARTPEGLRVATDGRVALLRLDVDVDAGVVDLDLPPYEQDIPDGKARALLVFGSERAPTVVVQGKAVGCPVGTVTVGGRTAHVIPLFGEGLAEVLDGLAERFAAAQARLEPRLSRLERED